MGYASVHSETSCLLAERGCLFKSLMTWSACGIYPFNGWSHFVDSLIPPLNMSMYSCTVELALPPLQPLVDGILQCSVIGIMVSSY